MNTIASYEDNQQKLVEALKQKEEEISKLKKEIEVTKEQYDIK
jgi:hypothetical protein